MNHFFLVFSDYFFLLFHSLLIIFNLSGWIWKKTRRLHFISMLATLSSWFIAGIWLGWGYCFCTDWHWQVREQLGNPIINDSYAGFLINELSGFHLKENTLDNSILILFFISFILSAYYIITDFKFSKKYSNLKKKN